MTRTLKISEEMHHKLKLEAVRQQRTLREVTEEMACEWLERHREEDVGKASGG